MSRNGSGVYSLPAGNPVVTGTTISSSWANTTLSDIATALTGSVAADGQTAMTGNLQMGNNKITGLAVATASGDALSYGQAATISSLTVSGAFAANGGATLGDASGDALTINSSAVSIPNGLNFDSNTLVIDATNNRVGVGTASPSFPLDVSADAAVIRVYSSTTTNGATTRYINGGGTGYVGLDSSSGGLGAAYGLHLFHSGAYPIVMSTNSIERVRITSAGNVGVGVTNPIETMQVNGVNAVPTSEVFAFSVSGVSDATKALRMGYDNANDMAVIAASDYGSGWKSIAIQPTGSNGVVGIGLNPTSRNNTCLQIVNGIGFPATQVASSDPNTLDDYEEGNWTPTIATTGTQPTVSAYNSRGGSYTKIGNIVTCSCNIRATLSSAGTGTPFISGLPFANASYLDGVALGLTDLLLPIPNVQWVDVTDVYFSSTWRTGVLNYCTFTVTYRVS